MIGVEIQAKIDWLEIEPGGETCCGCGCAVYLKGFSPYFSIIGSSRPEERLTEYTVCQSCFDLL